MIHRKHGVTRKHKRHVYGGVAAGKNGKPKSNEELARNRYNRQMIENQKKRNMNKFEQMFQGRVMGGRRNHHTRKH